MTIRSAIKAAALPAALLSFALSMPAQATVYDVNLAVGGGSAVGTITTDGTLGMLSVANITGWSLNLTSGASSVALVSGDNTRVRMFGSSLSATSTALSFDFSAQSYTIFERWPSSGTLNFLCITGSPNCGGAPTQIALAADNSVSTASRTGVQQIASAVAPVPEPASWAMMIGGLGIAGAALRGRGTRLRIA